MNFFKTVFLLSLLSVLFVYAGRAMGGQTGMTIALIFVLGMNFFSYWFSDKIVLRMYGAQEVDERSAPELCQMVRYLATKAELPMPRVYIINEAQPNAFATGRNPSHAAVAVTAGIMNILSREELEGVIGHELAHVRHRDILTGTIVAVIAGAVSYIATMAQWAMIFGRSDDDEGGGGLVGDLAMMIVAPIAAMLIQMAISRTREYAADEGGARIVGNPRSLASALQKLHMASHEIPMHANPATAHMFIVSPLTGGGILSLFSTHPPMEKRIERLRSISL
ncbi:MAG TPA: zinc metalloprotease HtpX [Thermodesulfovibrionia bacterium]|nr:zinc metalloprotease HtpX [Thermodesulfovibrionia bacterium]